MYYFNLQFNRRFMEFGEKLQMECPNNDCTIFRNLFKDYCDQYAAYKKIQEAFPDLPDSTARVLRDGIRSTMKELSDMRLNNFAVQKEFYRLYPYEPLRQISDFEVASVLLKHQKWLDSLASGSDITYGTQANFSFCDLRHVDFSNKDLSYALFYGSDLRNVKFDKSHLSTAYFSRANVSGVDFSGIDLEFADFRGAKMNGTIFTDANLTDAVFDNISGAVGLEESTMRPSVLDKLHSKQQEITRQGKDSPTAAKDVRKKDDPAL